MGFSPVDVRRLPSTAAAPSGYGSIYTYNNGTERTYQPYSKMDPFLKSVSALFGDEPADAEGFMAESYTFAAVTDPDGGVIPAGRFCDFFNPGATLVPASGVDTHPTFEPTGLNGRPSLNTVAASAHMRARSNLSLNPNGFGLLFVGELTNEAGNKDLINTDNLPAAGAGHGQRIQIQGTGDTIRFFSDGTNAVSWSPVMVGLPLSFMVTWDTAAGAQLWRNGSLIAPSSGAQDLAPRTVSDLTWFGKNGIQPALWNKFKMAACINTPLGGAAAEQVAFRNAFFALGAEMIGA